MVKNDRTVKNRFVRARVARVTRADLLNAVRVYEGQKSAIFGSKVRPILNKNIENGAYFSRVAEGGVSELRSENPSAKPVTEDFTPAPIGTLRTLVTRSLRPSRW